MRLYLGRIKLFDDSKRILDKLEEFAEDMVLLMRSHAKIEIKQHIFNKLIN
jgi:hypothetical protein